MSQICPEMMFKLGCLRFENRRKRKLFENQMIERFGDRFKKMDCIEHLNAMMNFPISMRKTEIFQHPDYASYNRFGSVSNRAVFTHGIHSDYDDRPICLIDFNGQANYIIMPVESH